jgi:hypothetical protein
MVGFESLEGDSRRCAFEMLGAVRDEGFVGWNVIVTCQPQAWEPTQDALIEAGLSEFKKVDFEKPKVQEIYDAVRHLPEIRLLLGRTQLLPILRNLVILDWVLRAELAQRFSRSSRAWIGNEFINCVWEHWTGAGTDRIARDCCAVWDCAEGEKLVAAAIDSLEKEQLTLLGTLAQEGLIRVELPSVRFSHDLMGDWARFRVLSLAGIEAAQRIKAVAPIPRWGHAIRLYAQSLIELGDGPTGWRSVAAQLGGEDAETQLASDLFLDGLLFAANSEPLLEQVWPDLIANEGVILRRLIKRLELVASVPDMRLRGFVAPKVAEQSEIWFRIPHPLYWYPALCVFSRHSQEVSKHALLPAAELCALWLRTMPDVFAGGREAGLLALELAKETQGSIAEGMHFSSQDQVVYEAVLSAAREFPEEVTQIGRNYARDGTKQNMRCVERSRRTNEKRNGSRNGKKNTRRKRERSASFRP